MKRLQAARLWAALMQTTLLVLSQHAAAEDRPEAPITLNEAVTQAFTLNPVVRVAEARLQEAEGRLTGAEVYPNNPVLQAGAAARTGNNQTSVDWEVRLQQQIQIAGQRGKRVAAAERELEAERSRLLRAKRLLAANVHLAFVAALRFQQLRHVARTDMELAERLHTVAQRRMERGAATQLDVNVAAAEFGRAEARLQTADARCRVACARLAETIGLDPTVHLDPQGTLHVTLDRPASLETLTQQAQIRRADLKALRDMVAASEARVTWARAVAWPDITVGVSVGHEERTDTLFGGTLSIPIPLFNRNQGQVAQAGAAVKRAQAEQRQRELSAAQEVTSALARYEAALRAANRLRQLVLGTLGQNLELLQRSFDAGKATWPEVVVIRRSLVDAQRQLANAEAQARTAWITLQIASGNMPLPETTPAREPQS